MAPKTVIYSHSTNKQLSLTHTSNSIFQVICILNANCVLYFFFIMSRWCVVSILDVSELSCSVCFNSSVLLSAYNINVLHSKAAKIARARRIFNYPECCSRILCINYSVFSLTQYTWTYTHTRVKLFVLCTLTVCAAWVSFLFILLECVTWIYKVSTQGECTVRASIIHSR
jgi:hypothetical protein